MYILCVLYLNESLDRKAILITIIIDINHIIILGYTHIYVWEKHYVYLLYMCQLVLYKMQSGDKKSYFYNVK